MFQDARSLIRLTRGELAYRLQTSEHTIAILEAGAIGALPSWPETQRLVEGYAGLAKFDPGSLLAHLEARLRARAVRSYAATDAIAAHSVVSLSAERPANPVPVAVQAPERAAMSPRSPSRPWLRLWPAMMMGTVVAGIAAGFYWAAFARPPVLMAAVNLLPATISGPVRSAMDGIVILSAPKRDGLRWIEVDDPRTRKADKLRINAE